MYKFELIYVDEMNELEEMASHCSDFIDAWDDGGKAVDGCPRCAMELFDDDLPF